MALLATKAILVVLLLPLGIDAASSIHIYSLSTVGVTTQLSFDGEAVIDKDSNVNGFASTVTAWSP